MKQCNLENFTESLYLWLDHDYIRHANIDAKGRVTFTFMDGVKESFQIIGCDRTQVKKACRCLAERGIPVREG